MKINLRGKNIEVTDALGQYVEKRIGKLDKFFDTETEAQVCLSVTRENNIIEVTIMLNGMILRGEESTPDMYASIDQVVEKLEKQVEKYKTKMNRNLRQKSVKRMIKADPEESVLLEDEPKVVRVKRFAMKPMTVEEAILQMNLLDHDFFLFFDADVEAVSVIYRRKDGDYGLIEPEIS
ncbi:ribosome hibernation-promoting factor, HPF/YfiA family [Candidatus Contubernalis alkaliaceticus]|uniref:ribosome hibernation-promoting factor, HPF/YfiA family n=1 Tax=Candidatus Contubernalis alkaliaceticus TaxID=338645 RepID=UPI001F4BDBE6|nr:ribosome-associated translation inhibitor RaiA [Candidatus Contubernalis alkalaceticus]UNC90766.1 ribosome-associated translation inhibitor RaiA [Candidatus Contubernalis alkalaceticus]